MDYEHARLTFAVNVLVGLPTEQNPDRERCRPGAIVFEGVLFYSVEFPQVRSSFQHPGPAGFSYERTSAGEIPEDLEKVLLSGTQSYSFFMRDWLSHIYIAAADVSFLWSDR
jgi:hypothetical protein